MSDSRPTDVLPEALGITQALVVWLLRSGVGYGEFVSALKPLFLAQAERELRSNGRKVTDSALSLLSGLHRKDVRTLRATAEDAQQAIRDKRNAWGKPSLANQVITRWMTQVDMPDTLPMAGTVKSFESLVQSVSRDVHPRTVLSELQRLGMVREVNGQVQLMHEAFVPDPEQAEARHLMAGAVADHLHAGVHNLSTQGQGKFLEQSVFADGLSPESIKQLQQLANALWSQVLQQVVQVATPLCEQDAAYPEPQRFRLGLFSYSAPETDLPVQPKASSEGDSSERSS